MEKILRFGGTTSMEWNLSGRLDLTPLKNWMESRNLHTLYDILVGNIFLSDGVISPRTSLVVIMFMNCKSCIVGG
jgi:hypothetical protein